jgi:uncharacterized protein DUF2147
VVQRSNRSRHINHEDEKQGGEILDPENGKIYRVRIKLEDGGKKLTCAALSVFRSLDGVKHGSAKSDCATFIRNSIEALLIHLADRLQYREYG